MRTVGPITDFSQKPVLVYVDFDCVAYPDERLASELYILMMSSNTVASFKITTD